MSPPLDVPVSHWLRYTPEAAIASSTVPSPKGHPGWKWSTILAVTE